MDQDETWQGGRPGPRSHCVWGTQLQLPPPQRHNPQLLAHVCCGQTAGWIKMPLGTEVGLSPGDITLMGTPLLLPKSGQSPSQFSAHVYCGQRAGWIKMPLGVELCLGSSHIVLNGEATLLPQNGAHTQFSAHVLWPNGWMDQDATWYAGRPRFRPHCVTCGPRSPKKEHSPPNFRPMSIVAKRSPVSAAAEHLF